MRHIKIVNNVVVRVQPIQYDSKNKAIPVDGLIEASDSVIAGMVKDGENFTKPLQTLIQAKEIQQDEVLRDFNTAVGLLSTDPSHVMTSWWEQEEQARAWDKNNTAVVPMIDGILSARLLGETKQQFVDLVIYKADYYKVEYPKLLGKWQRLKHKIRDATNINIIKTHVW